MTRYPALVVRNRHLRRWRGRRKTAAPTFSVEVPRPSGSLPHRLERRVRRPRPRGRRAASLSRLRIPYRRISRRQPFWWTGSIRRWRRLLGAKGWGRYQTTTVLACSWTRRWIPRKMGRIWTGSSPPMIGRRRYQHPSLTNSSGLVILYYELSNYKTINHIIINISSVLDLINFSRVNNLA